MPGFLALIPAWMWRWLAIAALGAALFGYGYVRGYQHEERALDTFTAQVRAESEASQKLAALTAARNAKIAKDAADAYKARIAALQRSIPPSLLDPNSGRTVTASLPAGPNSDTLCFDRAKFDDAITRSYGRLQARLVGIAQGGDQAIAAEVTWGDWYKGVSH